jgi:hypothetical protein
MRPQHEPRAGSSLGSREVRDQPMKRHGPDENYAETLTETRPSRGLVRLMFDNQHCDDIASLGAEQVLIIEHLSEAESHLLGLIRTCQALDLPNEQRGAHLPSDVKCGRSVGGCRLDSSRREPVGNGVLRLCVPAQAAVNLVGIDREWISGRCRGGLVRTAVRGPGLRQDSRAAFG